MKPSNLLLTLLSATVVPAKSYSNCSRTMLNDATGRYIAAQSSGTTAMMTDLGPSINYTENSKPTNIKLGILSKPLAISHSAYFLDTVNCASFTELIVANATDPYVIGTRILFSGQSITTIESIVTKPGDWAFNATGYLYWTEKEDWSAIPEEKRDSREVIKAAGDAYFDRFDNVNITVPFGTPCARLEGGAYTGLQNLTGNTCYLGLPSVTKVTNRRYVIDEVYGVVDIFLGFPGLDRSQGDAPMPDSHVFRVEGGKIRYIHTVSSCVEAGCGLNGTLGPTRRQSIRRSLNLQEFGGENGRVGWKKHL